MPGDEDNWQLNARRGEFALEIHAALSRQSHIEHETRGALRAGGAEKFRNGCK